MASLELHRLPTSPTGKTGFYITVDGKPLLDGKGGLFEVTKGEGYRIAYQGGAYPNERVGRVILAMTRPEQLRDITPRA